jgi:Mlc titration factor MtfA (ptsG expression regulator)
MLFLLFLDRNRLLRNIWFGLSLREQYIKRNIDQSHTSYIKLNHTQKREFHWRVYFFLHTTDFIIKFKGPSDKIKITISFAAAQISWRLPIQCFTMYEKVIVYEDDYFSQINQTYHKGEVNPGLGIIVFSWKSILIGLSRSDDGLNILVHEFAHALRLEHLMKHQNYVIFDEEDFERVNEISKAELENMRSSENHFLRRYAATNIDEFFAVASESFFERPLEMKHHVPEIYKAFAGLYKQNTL